jgi:hypothetical protein
MVKKSAENPVSAENPTMSSPIVICHQYPTNPHEISIKSNHFPSAIHSNPHQKIWVKSPRWFSMAWPFFLMSYPCRYIKKKPSHKKKVVNCGWYESWYIHWNLHKFGQNFPTSSFSAFSRASSARCRSFWASPRCTWQWPRATKAWRGATAKDSLGMMIIRCWILNHWIVSYWIIGSWVVSCYCKLKIMDIDLRW